MPRSWVLRNGQNDENDQASPYERRNPITRAEIARAWPSRDRKTYFRVEEIVYEPERKLMIPHT